jgi:hypothetical protein
MGHGQILAYKQKKLLMTHRVSWEHFNGPIPVGFCVLHKCDIPACVNPDHLFLGTKADNTADMIKKGRMKTGKQLPHTKLSDADIEFIRSATGSQSKIAKQFGISQGYVSLLRNGHCRKS